MRIRLNRFLVARQPDIKQYGKMGDSSETHSSSTKIKWNITVSDNIQTEATSRVNPEHLCFPKWIQVKRIFIVTDPDNPLELKILKL